MEQFLKNFFNDNSVCIGLKDLGRKVAEVQFSSAEKFLSKEIQPQMKPQRQTLAQYFAAQQQAYAAQQAYASQKTTFSPQSTRVKNPYAPPEVESYIQRTNSQPCFKQQVRQQQTRQVNDVQSQSAYKQPITIIDGNMKKVISPAVPARR